MEDFISHREFYAAQLLQALKFYLGEKTSELAWMLVERLGMAHLFGVNPHDVVDDLREFSGLSDSDSLTAESILLPEGHAVGQAQKESLMELIRLAFAHGPSLDLGQVIEDYLEDIDQRISDEWKEEDDEIITYHTGTVAAYQWLSEKIMEDEDLLPLFIKDLDDLGTMISAVSQTVRAQFQLFLGGKATASFIYRGVIKERLTPNFIFLTDEFFSIKGPDFVLPLPQPFEHTYPPVRELAISEPEKPFWREGLREWQRGREGVVPPFIAANLTSKPYEFPVERRPGWMAMGKAMGKAMDKETKRVLPPALEANWIALDIIVPHDRKSVILLPPESPSKEELEKLNSVLTYIRQFAAYYYAIRGEAEGVTVYSREAKPVPTSITRRVVKDIPPETRLLIVGLHQDPDILNQVMRGVFSNEDLRKKGKGEVFFLLYLPAEDK